jgi:hypothetical protein
MRQAEIMIGVEQCQLLAQSRLMLTHRVGPTADSGHVLTAVFICQPRVASTCLTASSVPNTTRGVTRTMRRRR